MASAIGNKKAYENKLKAMYHNDPISKRLYTLLFQLNPYDMIRLIGIYNESFPLTSQFREVAKSIAQELARIQLPCCYLKAIQIDTKGIVVLNPSTTYPVLEINWKTRGYRITTTQEIPIEECIALLGRHPFKDELGWTYLKPQYDENIPEGCFGISQYDWKNRGGDFDGDAAVLLLMKWIGRKYPEIKIEKEEYKNKEHIEIPKKVSKATTTIKLNINKISDFDFIDVQKFNPESISFVQNSEVLDRAILMSLEYQNIATSKKQWQQEFEQFYLALKTAFKKILNINIENVFSRDYLKILYPILKYNNLDIEKYQAVLRMFIKDKGPALYGALQKYLLSVTTNANEIREVLKWIDTKQQAIIDMKKSEHPLELLNKARLERKSENLKETEIGKYIKRFNEIETTWCKKPEQLLFGHSPQCEIDLLITAAYLVARDPNKSTDKIVDELFSLLE